MRAEDRRDRDSREPVDAPPVGEPADDPAQPLPEPPVGDPDDSPGHGEPGRRDPDPREPPRRDPPNPEREPAPGSTASA
jgi:hypothetical protein